MAKTDERRAAPRFLRDERLLVKIIASPARPQLVDTAVECATVDVSTTGLRVLLEYPVAPGSQLALEVEALEQEECFFLGGVVQWSRETEVAGSYLIGVELFDATGFDLERWRRRFL